MPPRPRIGPLPPARRKRPPRRPPTKRPPPPKKPPLRIYSILAWADAHRRRTGRWPSYNAGEVHEAPWETWKAIDSALRGGFRGCRPGGSLARLLAKHRGKRLPAPSHRGQPLTIKQILRWADAHHRRTGRWPSGQGKRPVLDAPGEIWTNIDAALYNGRRGLPGGDSLAKLLLRYRGVRRTIYRPPLSIPQILAWADKHHRRSGRWPHWMSGHVAGSRDETWMAMHMALMRGKRGLPRGYTLASLLEKFRGMRHKGHLPRFSHDKILAWADAYHRRTGQWPSARSGPIPESPGDSWRTVAGSLWKGLRGLPGRQTIFRVLLDHGRLPPDDGLVRRARIATMPPLSIRKILRWADEHFERTGRWPNSLSGKIPGAGAETWGTVNAALVDGRRGFRSRLSLATLLEKRRGVRHKGHLPRFTPRKILAWAAAHRRRTGRWPRLNSGPIPESPGDTWRVVESALWAGCRGLPGRDTLFRFLLRHKRLAAVDWRVKRLRTLAGQGIAGWAPPPGGRKGQHGFLFKATPGGIRKIVRVARTN